MTDCAMCGDCCENIGLNVDVSIMKARLANGRVAGKDRKELLFITENFIPTGRVETRGGKTKRILKCLKFDKKTRQCTAHDERPTLCRRYPWYGGEPVKGDTTMGGRCSYLADAYKMLPIVEVR